MLFGPMEERHVTEAKRLLPENAPLLNRFARELLEEIGKGTTEERADALRSASPARVDPDVPNASLYFDRMREMRDHHVRALLLLSEHTALEFHVGRADVALERRVEGRRRT